MTKQAKPLQPSKETQDEALKIAHSIQQPSQTKEQTKLIAKGIQKGIQLYKKQQKARSRELDKKAKKLSGPKPQSADIPTREIMCYRQHWLPWFLLILTWLGIALFLFFFRN